jgi:hypothetical protein
VTGLAVNEYSIKEEISMTRQRCTLLLAAVTLMAVSFTLIGCSSGGTPSSGATTAPQAQVTLAARFPTADDAVKSLLPSGTQSVEVYAMSLPYVSGGGQSLIATLTPAAPSKTIKMAPGLYMINAAAYDSTDTTTRRTLAQTATGGEIVADSPNTVNLTFLNGQWTLATPVVLSDGSQLNDFVVGNEYYQPTQVSKTGFDYTKPYNGGSGAIRYRFSNNSSARTYGNMISQFVGTANSIAIFASDYNLTQKCSKDMQYSSGACEQVSGDRIVMIDGQPDGGTPPSESGESYYQGELLYGNANDLLPAKGKTTFAQNGTALDLLANIPAATSDGKTVTGSLIEFVVTDRVKSLKTAAAKVAKATNAGAVKAQSANTTYAGLAVTDTKWMICSPTGGTNTGTWSFQGATATNFGSAICYNYGYQVNYGPGGPLPNSAGDFSYGLVPTDTSRLGDYCHVFDYLNYVCTQQAPGSGEVYDPNRFVAKKSATKTAIDYGSFKFNFWIETRTTGTGYVYPFTATGSAQVSPAK